jgi:hypothetical protein
MRHQGSGGWPRCAHSVTNRCALEQLASPGIDLQHRRTATRATFIAPPLHPPPSGLCALRLGLAAAATASALHAPLCAFQLLWWCTPPAAVTRHSQPAATHDHTTAHCQSHARWRPRAGQRHGLQVRLLPAQQQWPHFAGPHRQLRVAPQVQAQHGSLQSVTRTTHSGVHRVVV